MRSIDPVGLRRGFTLIELLVVIAIIGLLVGLILPAVQSAREAARRLQCTNNLKQVGLALHAYHDAAGAFPPGVVLRGWPADPAVPHPPGGGWGCAILGWLEQRSLFDAFNFAPSFFERVHDNRTAGSAPIATFHCPSSAGGGPVDHGFMMPTPIHGFDWLAPGQYVGSAGRLDTPGFGRGAWSVRSGDGVFFGDSRVGLRDLRDGSSSTLLVGERSRRIADATWVGVAFPSGNLCTKDGWKLQGCTSSLFLALGRTGPSEGFWRLDDTSERISRDPNAGPDGFSSDHDGVGNFAMADGSVRFIKATIAPAVLRALATRAGGEVVDASAY
ncbi:DUF1559 domain-containing protein [Planctomyces sp. SH-PL62]|uniref:DUF1559 domain-containing protein n=1 Tax=Planctomyces sp. SH-PL62 TaxID=1636152 RepID=UPI00078EC867|nr:DUF1559 domain-containing protein [Planctomyces sp. SH-PL62]AMV35796.1 Type II secretion system protein G precursor [Planctomyces sp. SH-PL62]